MTEIPLALVVAVAKNGVIGMDGDMPWHLPDDLRWFVRHTKRKAVVMGRKTFDSIGGKPMKRRFNIVMTRQPDYVAEGCHVAHSLEEAIAAAGDREELVVMGGAHIYKLFLPRANRFYLTRIQGAFEGDTTFPPFEMSDWEISFHEHHPADERHSHAFDFYILDRKEETG